jgi:LmbE family N-acetylglucosaminyl deacetylase
MSTVMVIAAHPDDEVLGCGGTIARHVRQGDEVHVLILAEGITSRDRERDRPAREKEISELGQAAHRANTILGTTSLTLQGFPDNRMDSVDQLDIVKAVEAHLVLHPPTVVYTHHAGDVNIDHRCIHDAVNVVCRPQPGHPVRRLLYFETPSSTEWQPATSSQQFAPNWFVDIDLTLEIKLQSLEAYAPEMRDWPHPRSLRAVEHLARWRGATAGMEAAEAFMVGRVLKNKEV